MTLIRANPSEYLIIGRGGKLTNLGTAIQTYLWPGSVFAIIPSIKQEATFELTHESKDGIPLRFKGIVVYRITDPLAAARQFDFRRRIKTDPHYPGTVRISKLIGHICMGELRAVVSHMTMQDCIEQRKTTLTQILDTALGEIIRGKKENDGVSETGWGIELEVVQVSQVFIVDDELRRQLEANTRNEIMVSSEKSEIQSQEEIKLTQIISERRMQQELLKTHQKKIEVARDEFRLQQEAEQEKIELETPVQLLRAQQKLVVLEAELEMMRLAKQVKSLEVEIEMMLEAARQRLQAKILPLEQIPQVVESAAQIFQGTNLSVYGNDGQLFALLDPLVDLINRILKPLSQDSHQEK